jgi:SAM-dependent methyltransferase
VTETGAAVRSSTEFAVELSHPRWAQRRLVERALARLHEEARAVDLPARCEICREWSLFRVDNEGGGHSEGGVWQPNWRERLLCASCGLNCRQRALASRLAAGIGENGGRLYMMERLSPLYGRLSEMLGGDRVVGSEYLGPDRLPGEVVQGIRHEDAEKLSFESRAFRTVGSADVLEHVGDPATVLAEVRRVLEPGGTFWFTVPFYSDRERSTRRAERIRDEMVHHLPREIHGDPLLPEGALVVTDFGWDLMDMLRDTGFSDCWGELYWDLETAYLGIGHLLFAAVAPLDRPSR